VNVLDNASLGIGNGAGRRCRRRLGLLNPFHRVAQRDRDNGSFGSVGVVVVVGVVVLIQGRR